MVWAFGPSTHHSKLGPSSRMSVLQTNIAQPMSLNRLRKWFYEFANGGPYYPSSARRHGTLCDGIGVSHTPSFSLYLVMPLSLPLSLPLSFPLSLFLSLSLSFPLSLFPSPPLSLSLSLSLCMYMYTYMYAHTLVEMLQSRELGPRTLPASDAMLFDRWQRHAKYCSGLNGTSVNCMCIYIYIYMNHGQDSLPRA